MRFRKRGGTISAKMGLLQAGWDQLFSRPMLTSTAAYMTTVAGAPFSGSPWELRK